MSYAGSKIFGGGDINYYNASKGDSTNLLSPLMEPNYFYSIELNLQPIFSLYKDHDAYIHTLFHREVWYNFYLTIHPFLFHPSTNMNCLKIKNEVDVYRNVAEDALYDLEPQESTMDLYFVFEINHENLFEQTLEKLRKVDPPNELRKKLCVV